MKTRAFSHFCLLVVCSLIGLTVSLAQTASISYYSGNTHIPLNEGSTDITFKVDFNNMFYTTTYGWGWGFQGQGLTGGIYNLGSAHTSLSTYFTHTLSPGNWTLYVDLYQQPGWSRVSTGTVGITITKDYSITVENSYGGGNVTVDATTYSSGQGFTWESNNNHSLVATDNYSYGGYVRLFQNWSGPGLSGSGTSVTAFISQAATYRANFLRQFNVTFQNNFPGHGNGETSMSMEAQPVRRPQLPM